MTANRFFVKFNGGLGNQMFQWAFAKSLAQKYKMQMLFDMSYFEKKYARPFELEKVFSLQATPVTKKYDKFRLALIWFFRRYLNEKALLDINFIKEKHFGYCPYLMEVPPETYIEGFFQTEKYFINTDYAIRQDLTFKNELDEKNKEIAEQIKNSMSVSIHIRRGDYVQKKRYQDMYATCTPEYYKRAVDIIAQEHQDIKLFVFSDDIPWVRENIEFPFETIFIDHNKGLDSYKDMQLMSLCKHNIIANSSFSWWGAWLNNNYSKIVIAPKKWFNDEKINQSDIIPATWFRIDN